MLVVEPLGVDLAVGGVIVYVDFFFAALTRMLQYTVVFPYLARIVALPALFP